MALILDQVHCSLSFLQKKGSAKSLANLIRSIKQIASLLLSLILSLEKVEEKI
jgi:hypothetical protein